MLETASNKHQDKLIKRGHSQQKLFDYIRMNKLTRNSVVPRAVTTNTNGKQERPTKQRKSVLPAIKVFSCGVLATDKNIWQTSAAMILKVLNQPTFLICKYIHLYFDYTTEF